MKEKESNSKEEVGIALEALSERYIQQSGVEEGDKRTQRVIACDTGKEKGDNLRARPRHTYKGKTKVLC